MPPLPLLTQKDALFLAKQASEDFCGLEILLRPVIVPRPLTEQMTISGYMLIVAGQRGTAPWFTCTSVADYEHLYTQVYEYYETDTEPEDINEDDGADEVYPPALPPLSPLGLVGRSAGRENGSA